MVALALEKVLIYSNGAMSTLVVVAPKSPGRVKTKVHTKCRVRTWSIWGAVFTCSWGGRLVSQVSSLIPALFRLLIHTI